MESAGQEAVEEVGARARIIPPVGEDMIPAISMFQGPGPSLGYHVAGFDERHYPVAGRCRAHGGHVFHKPPQGTRLPAREASQGPDHAQVMESFRREHLLVQDVEPVARHLCVEWVEREYFDLDARFDQRPHVALEEGRDPGGILARDHGQPERPVVRSLHHDIPCFRSHSSSESALNTR